MEAPDDHAGLLTGVKAVFFDAVGTLIYLPRGVGYHYADVARRHGATAHQADLEYAFRAVWKAMPARQACSGPRPDDDKGWWRELVGRVVDLAELHLDRDAYFEELYSAFAEPGVWALFPEVVDVLRQLRGSCKLGVISNFDGRLRRILDQLEVADFFSQIVLSSEVGADKPDPRIFAVAMQKFGVRAAESLHIGDDAELDWAPAAKLGMRVFRLDRPTVDLRRLLRASGF